MKKILFLISVVFGLSCGREETALLVPVDTPQPPVILSIIKNELNCSMPFNVVFNAPIANQLGSETYSWTIGGVSYSGKSPQVMVNQTGDLEVKLRVTNTIGLDEKTVTFNYASNTLPVIPNFNYGAENDNFRVPAKLTFTDLSQRATGVKWDFGDGYQSSLKNPEHIYNQAGTYTITLTAWCDADTAQQTAQVTILSEPDIIRFDRFEILGFPKNYFPEDSDDDTHGGDFYVAIARDNFTYGTGDVQVNKSKLPVYWRCPEEWNGDYKLIFYSFGVYKATLWDQNDNDDTEMLNAIFDGTYLKNNYYPRQLDFESDELRFRIYLDYED